MYNQKRGWVWTIIVSTSPVDKARNKNKTGMRNFSMEYLYCPAQISGINLIKNIWSELERRVQTRPCHPPSVSDLRDETNGQNFPIQKQWESKIQRSLNQTGEHEMCAHWYHAISHLSLFYKKCIMTTFIPIVWIFFILFSD